MESDETRIRNAAHLMVASLAGSLAHVTCKVERKYFFFVVFYFYFFVCVCTILVIVLLDGYHA